MENRIICVQYIQESNYSVRRNGEELVLGKYAILEGGAITADPESIEIYKSIKSIEIPVMD